MSSPPDQDSRSAQLPDRIGPYRVLEELGRGGMGVVYRAEQREPMRRTVALKVVQAGMATSDVLARFEFERRALAAMNHRFVAKVFDAGATERGEPYFVMELIEGLPVTQYCDTHRLSLPDRLRLFQKVCQGVQHAHHVKDRALPGDLDWVVMRDRRFRYHMHVDEVRAFLATAPADEAPLQHRPLTHGGSVLASAGSQVKS